MTETLAEKEQRRLREFIRAIDFMSEDKITRLIQLLKMAKFSLDNTQKTQ